MSDSQYMSALELREIASIVEMFNDHDNDPVALGDTPLFDTNGEPLGTVSMSDAGFVFYPTSE